MIARKNLRLRQVGSTYELSKFEYVLPVFVDHTSKCDLLDVEDEKFWDDWSLLKQERIFYLILLGREVCVVFISRVKHPLPEKLSLPSWKFDPPHRLSIRQGSNTGNLL